MWMKIMLTPGLSVTSVAVNNLMMLQGISNHLLVFAYVVCHRGFQYYPVLSGRMES